MTTEPETAGDPGSRRTPIDPAVIEAARAGDRQAMESLVKVTSREAYGFAFWLTRNHADAEDVVQEAYIRALRGLQSFRAESSFLTWLCRIIHNTFINNLRASGRAEAAADASMQDRQEPRQPDPAEGAMLLETRGLMERSIALLPPRQREAIVLHSHHGMSYDEIAEVMGTTRENVKVNISLARKKLMESMRLGR